MKQHAANDRKKQRPSEKIQLKVVYTEKYRQQKWLWYFIVREKAKSKNAWVLAR